MESDMTELGSWFKQQGDNGKGGGGYQLDDIDGKRGNE